MSEDTVVICETFDFSISERFFRMYREWATSAGYTSTFFDGDISSLSLYRRLFSFSFPRPLVPGIRTNLLVIPILVTVAILIFFTLLQIVDYLEYRGVYTIPSFIKFGTVDDLRNFASVIVGAEATIMSLILASSM